MNYLSFKIDTRLTLLLSENYRSSERALKELVDNAWDADASAVNISLPAPMTDNPIVIEDDGSGMTSQELAAEYLNIASNRRARRGDLTSVNKRQVKGRKGIGKFAGFMSASRMNLKTWARGEVTSFSLDQRELEGYTDLPEMPINVDVTKGHDSKHGTRIVLTNLHQNLQFPCAEKLRQLLLHEYGREHDFKIVVNGKPLDIDDLQGVYTESTSKVGDVGDVKIRFTISDQKKSVRKSGIQLRVKGKIVGEPSYFGLDKSDDFPEKLLKKCFGEIEVDGLLDDVTADWGAVVEGSQGYRAVAEVVQPILREKFKEVYGQEIHLSKARLQKKYNERISSLPEHKRKFADRAIKRVLERFYQEPEDKVEPVVNVLLDAIERSDYRAVLEQIHESKHSEVALFAEALDKFGIFEMANMAEQASSRLAFIDYLETLCESPSTLEKDVHRAIEHNLWLFGPEYSLFSSNRTLKKQIEEYLDREYAGENAEKRPDLVLSQNLNGERLLIEFKRPSHNLKYIDYRQATEYRNDFRKNSMAEQINVLLIGGRKGGDLPQHQDREPNIKILLFSDLISSARRQMQWFLEQVAF